MVQHGTNSGLVIFNALLEYGYQMKGLVMNRKKEKKVSLLKMQYGGISKMVDQIF
jgi:hypothetical protein